MVRHGLDWTGLAVAHERERWRALLKAVMNLRVQKIAGNVLTS